VERDVANIPPDLQYTKEHEYVKATDDPAVVAIGITDYAQGELGDIVYLDLPKPGRRSTGTPCSAPSRRSRP
jgi:glycine cleavage system H protein